MRLTYRQKLVARMRRIASAAAYDRLSGYVGSAVLHDKTIERIYAEARRRGYSEDFLVVAESNGRMLGQRAFDRERGARTSSPSGRDRRRRRRSR